MFWTRACFSYSAFLWTKFPFTSLTSKQHRRTPRQYDPPSPIRQHVWVRRLNMRYSIVLRKTEGGGGVVAYRALSYA
jgi:hypothetical protein